MCNNVQCLEARPKGGHMGTILLIDNRYNGCYNKLMK